jgi:hypothetical protein
MMNWKKFGKQLRWPIRGIIQEFAWRNLEKKKVKPLGLASVPVEI